jgi:hypothetical protein
LRGVLAIIENGPLSGVVISSPIVALGTRETCPSKGYRKGQQQYIE